MPVWEWFPLTWASALAERWEWMRLPRDTLLLFLSVATGQNTCFGLGMHDLVPFWLCVFAACAVAYYISAKEGPLLGALFSRLRVGKASGYTSLFEAAPRELEAADAPPTSVCRAERMLALCSELGVQRGLEAASAAVLLVLQLRRRYGAASLAVSDGGPSARTLRLPLDLEASTLAFSELLKAVDLALREPPTTSSAESQESADVIFQWNGGVPQAECQSGKLGRSDEQLWTAEAARGGESARWSARMDSNAKSITVIGGSSEEAQSFQILFEAAAEEASANVWQLPLLSKAASETVEAWGSPGMKLDRVKDPASGNIIPMPRLLASLSHAGSDRAAVAGDGFELSHRELYRRAAAVAEAVLRSKADGPSSPGATSSSAVVVYMGRGEDIGPAFLGVLQAGCHVVPADLHWPLERVRHVAEASGAVLVLAEGASAERWQAAGGGLPFLTLEEALRAQSGGYEAKLAAITDGLAQDDPAVILFTSGSTGLPKGIVLSHGYLTALIHGIVESKGMTADTKALCYHSPTWMPFLDYLFGPLLKGGCCLYFPEGQSHVVSPSDLRAFGVKHGATSAGFVPAMLDVLLEEGLPSSLRRVGVGGAAVPAELCHRAVRALREISPNAVLYTGYSGTEQGDVTQLAMRSGDDVDAGASDAGFMGAGRPHGAQRCKVLDKGLQLVGVEGVGEICVSGPGLASGYLQLPEKTAETFIPSAPAFGGARMARSGDLGKWTSGGSVKVAGRRDSMVKVRGARVELGEVEAAVSSHAAVKAAVVSVWEDQLVAYVVPAVPADLREHCKACLVPYMVPHIFEGLEEIPRLPNGKVNRKALPTPAVRADGAETVMELDSLGQMRKFTRKAASEDRVLDNARAILIAVVIQSHAIHVDNGPEMLTAFTQQGLGANWGPVQTFVLRLVYSGGWSSLAFLSGFDDTRSMRPYGLTYREVLFGVLWPLLGFIQTLWYFPVFVYMRVAFCLAHRLGLERAHLLVAAQAWILLPAFVDFYVGWKPNGPPGPCPSMCYCPFEALPEAELASKLAFGWWLASDGNFTARSFLGHGMIFIPCYWVGFYTGGPIFRVLTRVADEPSVLRRAAIAAAVFAVYLVVYKLPVVGGFSDRCADFWSPDGSFVYQQVLKNLLYYALNLGMSLLYVFFIAACVPVHLKHLGKVSFSALVLSGFVPCINDYAVMALDLRRRLPASISPGMELAWVFSVPVVFVLVAGSILTAALPFVARGVLATVEATKRQGQRFATWASAPRLVPRYYLVDAKAAPLCGAPGRGGG